MIGGLIFAASVLTWLGSGYTVGGFEYSYQQKHYPEIAESFRTGDLFLSLSLSLLGPLGFATLALVGHYECGICWNWIMKPSLAAETQLDVATIRAARAQLKAAAPMVATFLGATSASTSLASADSQKELPKVSGTDPIVAYRVWKLDPKTKKLGSTFMANYFWPPRKRLERDEIDKNGIHAVKDSHRLLFGSDGPSTSNPTGISSEGGLWNQYDADVAGSVYLWGEVKECALGYLAQYAYPKELWMPENSDPLVVMELEELYGVPVTLRREFIKRTEPDSVAPPAMYQNQYQNQMIISYFFSACYGCGLGYTGSPSGYCPACEKRQAMIQSMMNATPNYGSALANAGTPSYNTFRVPGCNCLSCSQSPSAIVPYVPPTLP